jgi:hypothetical protein
MRVGLLVLGCLVGIAVLAGSAEAAVHSGKTNQGHRVTLVTDPGDELTRITIHRWKAPCRPSGRFAGRTSVVPPIDRSVPGLFFDRGSYKLHQANGDFDIKVKVAVRGERVSPRRWKGVFRPKVIAKRNGNLVARCNAGRIRWRATQRSS